MFTVAVYYGTRKVYYNTIKSVTFVTYICSYLGCIKDVYAWYCTWDHCKMILFDACGPVMPSSDGDAINGN